MLQVDIAEDGEIDLEVDAAFKIEQGIGVMQTPDTLDPGDLASLVRLMIPPLDRATQQALRRTYPFRSCPWGKFLTTASRQTLSWWRTNRYRVDNSGWLLLTSGLIVRSSEGGAVPWGLGCGCVDRGCNACS